MIDMAPFEHFGRHFKVDVRVYVSMYVCPLIIFVTLNTIKTPVIRGVRTSVILIF